MLMKPEISAGRMGLLARKQRLKTFMQDLQILEETAGCVSDSQN